MLPHPDHIEYRHAVVIGGGFAGLTAAVTLAEAGAQVTLVEAAERAGGRFATPETVTFSYAGATYRFPIEHGLHGLWITYRNIRRLLANYHLDRELTPVERSELVVRYPDGRVIYREVGERLRNTRVPNPLAPMVLLHRMDVLRDLLAGGPARYATLLMDYPHVIAFDGTKDVAPLDQLCVADLINRWPPLLRHYAEALARSCFFGELSEISLAAYLTGTNRYFTDDKRYAAFDILPADSQTALIGPLCKVIESLGGRVLLGVRAEQLELADGRAIAVHVRPSAGGPVERLPADAVVVALDPPGLAGLQRGTAESGLGEIVIPRAVTSLSVRLWYSRDLASERASTGMLSGFEADVFFWLHRLQAPFRAWRQATGGSVIECHLYGARALAAEALEDETVIERVAGEVEQVWPQLAGARVYAHVRRNPATHVAFSPGTLSSLPAVRTGLANVALCGDWIACPSPVFHLERACATGLLAARALAASLGLDELVLPALLPPHPAAPGVALLRPLARVLRRARPLKPAAG